MSSADYGARPGRPDVGAEARILDELHALAAGRASGALRIDGDPGGAVYLDDGRLVFAEAVGVPDLGARLVGSRWVSPEEWQALRGVERAPGGLGELLVERGLVGRDDMLAMLRSVSLDAITALTVPVTGRPSVTGLRFASRERPWAGSMLSLEVESVRSEMARRARLLAGIDISLDALPVGADLRRPFGVVDHGQWLVASRVDGVTPLRELVWRNGLALYDTVESVGGLIREGMCVLLAPDRAAGSRAAAAPARTVRVPDQADTGAADPPWAAAPILAAPTFPDGPVVSEGFPDADISFARGQGMGIEHARDVEHATDARYEDARFEDARYENVGHEDARFEDARYEDARFEDARYENVGDEDVWYKDVRYGHARYEEAGYEDAGQPGAAQDVSPMPPKPPMPPMPQRRPGASFWDRVQADMQSAGLPQEVRQAARTAFTPATPDLLRRLLRGLRELDEDDPPSR